MEKLERLEQEFSELRDLLATLDVKIENTEQSFIHQEKCTTAWFNSLGRLNEFQRERHIVVSRMVTARLQIERQKNLEERRGA